MGVLEALLLGLVQGLTEFLPVSSSGHLVVISHLLGVRGVEDPGLLFDITVHVGTLLAVLVFYAKDLWRTVREVLAALPLLARGRAREALALPYARLGLLVLVGTIPTGLIGVFLEDTFEALFASPLAVGLAFLITGTFLFLTGRYGAGATARPVRGAGQMRLWDGLAVGFAQGLAITPGISRSGASISAALFLGLDRELAARFSFMLAIPAILGALVLHLRHGLPAATIDPLPLVVGLVTAAISGYFALRFLIRLLVRGHLGAFAWYLWPLGLAVIVWSLAR